MRGQAILNTEGIIMYVEGAEVDRIDTTKVNAYKKGEWYWNAPVLTFGGDQIKHIVHRDSLYHFKKRSVWLHVWAGKFMLAKASIN